jgi:polysaccharide deacetylase family protein (PEP-CTERM system associated)
MYRTQTITPPPAETAHPARHGYVNAFTVDVEDYFHAANLKVAPRQWDTLPSRVVSNTERLLGLLERQGIRATFFILGWVGRKFPQLVRRIDQDGHEIGSHSYWHRHIYELSPEEFREDLRLSKQVLEDITGKRIQAYRAPTFSVTRRSLWALTILAEEGIQYDSSIFPVAHDRYGIPDAPVEPFAIQVNGHLLWEIPPTVALVHKWRVPVAGGGYFRIFPFRTTSALLQRVQREGKRPIVFYIHPWEIDGAQPRIQTSWLHELRHYYGLSRCFAKLRQLLASIPFGPLSQCIGPIARKQAKPLPWGVTPHRFVPVESRS